MNNDIIQIATNLVGFGTAGIASIRWYNRYQKAIFTQERELNHLKNQSQQLSAQLVKTDEKLDELTAALVEMRGAIGMIIRDFGVTNRAIILPTFGSLEGIKGGGGNA
jgi:septal ring factor EnvC (AmiA/AmiB activator)